MRTNGNVSSLSNAEEEVRTADDWNSVQGCSRRRECRQEVVRKCSQVLSRSIVTEGICPFTSGYKFKDMDERKPQLI